MNDQTATTVVVPTEKAHDSWPRPAVAWYGVVFFGLTLLVLFMNASVSGLLIEPIKRDLGLSDVQASLAIGTAAAAFNALFMLPVSRLVDIISRRLIIGVGLILGGISAALAGLSSTFSQLFLVRMIGGIGGSGNAPATFSILADYFPAPKLPKALAVMGIGFYYGNALALLLGGTLLGFASTLHVVAPMVGALRPWQIILLIMAIPDVLLGILALTTLHEPKRRGARSTTYAADAGGKVKVVPLREVFKFLYDNRAAFAPMFLGLCANSLAAGAFFWNAPFFARTYGWSPAKYGVIQGSMLLVLAPIGALAGGYLAEWFARKGRDDANLRVVYLATLFHVPFAMAYALMPNPYLAIVIYAINYTIISMGSGPQNAALQVIVPNEMRGQITALFLFCFGMIGLALAPLVVASLTQYVFGAEEKLRYSIATIHIVLAPLATYFFWKGLKPYGKAFAAARAWH
ncbi:MAG TPA: MFS transporter [Steroidobacteraceae bacterium]|jgi:MFS family permease|nr:MFS transporter [Steroidobacteraceae bacterium]